MKSKTEYVKAEFVQDLKGQIATFKRFKKLMQQWVDLAIQHSKIKLTLAKEGKLKCWFSDYLHPKGGGFFTLG
jgi:hypothetical protein